MDNKDLFEGDMILPPHVRYKAEHGMDVDISRKRAAVKPRNRLWPKGEVPYVISNGLSKGSSVCMFCFALHFSEINTNVFKLYVNLDIFVQVSSSSESNICNT